jgi:hypothetical protein
MALLETAFASVPTSALLLPSGHFYASLSILPRN